MKNTGLVRELDNLGRLAIPKELRQSHNMAVGTPFEIYIDGQDIIFKRYKPVCVFCGNSQKSIEFKGRIVCDECLKDIK